MKAKSKSQEILISLARKHNGNWINIYQDICNKQYPTEEEISELALTNERCITLLDEEYPQQLKSTHRAPLVLFYEGNVDLLNKSNIVAISGSSINENELQCLPLNEKDITIMVSDNKKITPTIIETCQNNIILVCSCGIDKVPSELKEQVLNHNGLLISEYPNGVEKSMENCAEKYKIVAGLATKAIITPTFKKSGVMLAISQLLNLGKDIYVVPTELNNDYANNQLIYDGATPVYSGVQLKLDLQHC